MRSLEDYEKLKKVNRTRTDTQSKYIRKNLMNNIREHSNGESAFIYFIDKIKDGGLYLLDETEKAKEYLIRAYMMDGEEVFEGNEQYLSYVRDMIK